MTCRAVASSAAVPFCRFWRPGSREQKEASFEAPKRTSAQLWLPGVGAQGEIRKSLWGSKPYVMRYVVTGGASPLDEGLSSASGAWENGSCLEKLGVCTECNDSEL